MQKCSTMPIHNKLRAYRFSLTTMIIGCVYAHTLSLAAQTTYETLVQGVNQSPSINSEQVELINVGVGLSVIIESPWPAVRVSITQPTIADIQLLTPSQVLISGNTLGTTDLFLWNEFDEIWHAKVEVVVDLTYIEGELGKIFPDATLQVSQSRDIIIISGQIRRVHEVQLLQDYLDALGIKYLNKTSVAGVQQVMLRVRIAEASRKAIRVLGVDGFIGGSDFFGAFSVGTDAGGAANTTDIFFDPGATVGNADFIFGANSVSPSVTLLAGIPGADLILFLEALVENQYVRLLAEPSLIAISGASASFLAGGEFPVPIVQGGGDGGTSISIEYKEFGVKLLFEPIVLGDNTIRLHVAPEVSELSEFGAVTIEGFEIPSVLTRRAETTLELKSGQTFMIAGLLNSTTTARRSKVPLLGDLPILGSLFRSVRYVTGETELLIIVTASLVEPTNGNFDRPVPGDLHVRPSDWELFINGDIEGSQPNLPPAISEHLQQHGLDQLLGPGAWISYVDGKN